MMQSLCAIAPAPAPPQWLLRAYGLRAAFSCAGGERIGLLCAVLFAMVVIVGNVSIPDVQFVQTDFLAGL
jgi:hypothetical protein